MTLNVVSHYARANWPRRLRVRIARLAGSALFIVAAAASIPAIWLCLATLIKLYHRLSPAEPTPDDPSGGDPLSAIPNDKLPVLVLAWIGSIALFYFARWSSQRLLRVGRNQVLFLRRFRYAPATQAVSAAIGRLGADWRIVTLNDFETAPVGVDPAARFAATWWQRVGRVFDLPLWMLWVPIVASLAIGGIMLAGVGALWLAGFRDQDIFGWVQFLAPLANPIGLMALGLILTPAMIFVGSAMSRIRRAERSRVLEVRRIADVADVRSTARQVARAAYGPRLIVVDVVDGSIWRSVVAGFAADTAVALIDVSEPSEQVLWEIELLTTKQPRPYVVVAERSRAIALAQAPADNVLATRLATLLSGRPVLIYDVGGNRARRFARALRSALEYATQPASPRRSRTIAVDAPAEAIVRVEPAAAPAVPPTEEELRLRLTHLLDDALAYYAAQRPRQTVKGRNPFVRGRRLVGEDYRDGARRESAFDRNGTVETRLFLPRTITDRYGRRVLLVVVRDKTGRSTYDLRFLRTGDGPHGDDATVYRWSADEPIRDGNSAVVPGTPITTDTVLFEVAVRLAADVETRWTAYRAGASSRTGR